MKYNPNSIYEKPLSECPARCAECEFMEHTEYHDICIANDSRFPTVSYHNPKDSPLPFAKNCYWWYANRVWDAVSPHKIEGYKEQRLHLFVFHRMLARFPHGKERSAFIDHVFRPGGCCIIDFQIYPEVKAIYEEVKKNDGN